MRSLAVLPSWSLPAPRRTVGDGSRRLARRLLAERVRPAHHLRVLEPADGDLMLGGSRTVAAGQTRAFEHLRLRRDGERPVYTAIPSGQKETEFRSTAVSDTMFVVENPTHDFPTKISYRRVTADSVVAVVQGPGPNGMRGFAMGYGRVKCER